MVTALGYGLADRVELARVRAQLALLDELDDVWTAYLDDAEPSDIDREREELVELAGALQEAILVAANQMEWLVGILESFSEDAVEFAFTAIREVHPQVMEQFDAHLAEVLGEYSYRGLLIEACQLLRAELPEEADAVADKRARLQEGETQPGDMKPWRKCAMNVAVIGLGVAGIVMTGGAASGIVVSAASQVVSFGVTWEDGCSHVARRIWSRLHD